MKKLITLLCLMLFAFPVALATAAHHEPFALEPILSLLLKGPKYHKVNVVTTGLVGTDFSLWLNGKYPLPIPSDGSTSFPVSIQNFSNYQVTVKDPVTGITQACRINNGAGIITSKDAEVSIDCTILGYPVGGTVSGLDGVGLTLVLEDLTDGGFQRRQIKANGAFTLAALRDGAEYEVSILSQPTNKSQTCTLSNATGTVSGTSINDLGVSCVTSVFAVSVDVYGLASGETLEITHNAGLPNETSITVNGSNTVEPIVKNTSFDITDGNKYDLTVTSQPGGGKTCQLNNASGDVDGADVTDIQALCASGTAYSIGGTVSGLLGSRTTQLGLTLNNGLEELFVINNSYPSDVGFTFTTNLPTSKSAFGTTVPNTYNVSVSTQPNAMKCTVDANGSGAVGTGVTNVDISCLPYLDPTAVVKADAYVPNGGSLDGSDSTLGGSSSLTYNWGTSSVHDFVLTGNGTTNSTGTTIITDKFEDPLYLDDATCVNDPLCLDDILSNGASIDDTVANTNITLGVVGDEGHESTDSDTNYVYDESLAYVKKGGSGSGASPDDPAGDIKTGITYAEANGKRGVAIAQGTYTIDVDNGPITMVEGVSLFGGYSASTWNYDPETYVTDIRGSGTGVPDATSDFAPVATVVAGPEITAATWIRGLYVYSPNLVRDLNTTALWIKGGDMTVKNNTLRGFNTGGSWSGLTITGGSEAFIRNNTIYADGSPLVGDLAEAIGGAGIVMYGSRPTIESNRIRGGGAVGQGIVVFNSHPDIFNNIILGCEDGAGQQVCYGVKYLGDETYSGGWAGGIHYNSSGGKLYNNTILGGVPSPSNQQSDGTDGFAVFTVGEKSSPQIVNNILFSQDGASHYDSENSKVPCISSVNNQPGGLPASMYNNSCIDGTKIVDGSGETRFQRYVYKESTSLIEDVIAFLDEYNPLSSFIIWAFNLDPTFDEALHYFSFAILPLPELNYEDDGFMWGMRNAAESNAEELWEISYNSTPVLYEQVGWDDFHVWVSSRPTYTLSAGNVDIDRIDFFADFGGLDNDFSTIDDNDWHLTGSAPTTIIEGGKCLAPDVFRDLDGGASRTPSWSAASGCTAETGYSMGAYEYNY